MFGSVFLAHCRLAVTKRASIKSIAVVLAWREYEGFSGRGFL